MKILITLPTDRWFLGQITLLDDEGTAVLGPFPADGKSDDASAKAHGNPTRDPTKSFGDTPTGDYLGELGYEPDTPDNCQSYGLPDSSGKIPVIRMTPQQGDSEAWLRQVSEGPNVPMGLLIHSGPPNGNNQLRPTHGCVRTWQRDFSSIVATLKGLGTGISFPISIQSKELPT